MASYEEDKHQPSILVNRKQPTNTADGGAYSENKEPENENNLVEGLPSKLIKPYHATPETHNAKIKNSNFPELEFCPSVKCVAIVIKPLPKNHFWLCNRASV